MKVATRAKRHSHATPDEAQYALTPRAHAALREVIEHIASAARPMAYRLNPDHSVTPLDARTLGACNIGQPEARVAFDELGGPCYASTVFVGVPQARMSQILTPDAPPLLFETMARIGPNGVDEIRRFYATWEEAEAGHADLIAEHHESLKPPHSMDGRDYDD
jgi:hypothetical protein